MNTLDVRVFGIEERMPNIEKIKEQIPAAKIIIDKDHDGIISTSKKTWSLPTECSHVLVLNDDVELCENFVCICNTMINTHPHSIFSLFSFQFMNGEAVNRRGGFPSDSPYVEVNSVSGIGIIMPSRYIMPCINSWRENAKHDDTNICNWAIKNDIQILTTMPGIIQHLDFKSSVGHPTLQSKIYRKNPIANWNSSFVTNWSNI